MNNSGISSSVGVASFANVSNGVNAGRVTGEMSCDSHNARITSWFPDADTSNAKSGTSEASTRHDVVFYTAPAAGLLKSKL